MCQAICSNLFRVVVYQHEKIFRAWGYKYVGMRHWYEVNEIHFTVPIPLRTYLSENAHARKLFVLIYGA